jgi:hypothetical protein
MREQKRLNAHGGGDLDASSQISVSNRRLSWWSAIVIIVTVMLAAGIGQTSTGHTLLEKAGLFERPPGYTSLAFLNPASLPKHLKSKQVTVEVAFAIHNTSSISNLYEWSMSLVQKEGIRHVAAGSVRLNSERSATISRPVRITCSRGQVRIIVSLASPAEDIHAWAACES